MICKPTLRVLTLAGLGTLAASPVLAQDSYVYGGISAGQSRANVDHDRIAASLAGNGLSSTTRSDNRDTAYKVLGGYQVNRYFGMEATFFNLGQFRFHSDTVPAGTLDGGFKVQGAAFDLVGTLPLSEAFSVIGRVGGAYTRTRDSFRTSGAVVVSDPSPSQREGGPKLGIGMQYEINRSLFLRTEIESIRMSDALGQRSNVAFLSVGLVVPFGRAPMAARPMAAAYVAPYVAPMPAPAAVVAMPETVARVAPPPQVVELAPERKRVSFNAESLFAFDKATVQPEGKVALDAFAAEMRGTEFEVITVEGYTDRLGSTAYNQTLSEQRAAAVKAYLVSVGGFDAGKITAVGMSESAPVTKLEDCKGQRQTTKLVICLQPDRRVEVDVKGSK